MANHGKRISLSQYSQTSEDESSQHNSPCLATLSKGNSHLEGVATASPCVVQSKRSSPSFDQCIASGGDGGDGGEERHIGDGNSDHTNRNKKLKPPKKPRGRPRGSRNKPKPPIITITREDDQPLKPIIIEMSAGSDVVEELIRFAQLRNVGLIVLSGSGSVTNVTLCHTFSHTPITLHGTFTMLSLSGNYVNNHFPSSSPSPFASSSSSLPNPLSVIPWPGYSSFTICVGGAQGQVFGGVIAGRIIAASLVVVVVALYKKPLLHRVINNETDSFVIDLSDAEALKGGMNNSVMALPGSSNVMSASQ